MNLQQTKDWNAMHPDDRGKLIYRPDAWDKAGMAVIEILFRQKQHLREMAKRGEIKLDAMGQIVED
jgi:hypothetical protein